MFNEEYIPPTVTVDSVMFHLEDELLHVTLINRSTEPFKGEWALPGGYSAKNQTTHQALEAIVRRKTGIALDTTSRYTEQLYTFDTIARDPRGHAVSVTYMSCGLSMKPATTGTETTQAFPTDALPKLAYDHSDIISYAVERLRSKISYTNMIFALLPTEFTLSQLQSSYEAILGRPLDKRNFRKKFLQLDMIKATDQYVRDGAHRPAQLYIFKQKTLQTLERSFD